MPVDRDAEIAHRILKHFAANARDLPWRSPPGQPLPLSDPDWPYRVWLSEIMLQQTTVAAVKPYFDRFTARWPSVSALAAAPDEEVMSAWAGLGYYARARNLLACAHVVANEHGGRFPDDEEALRCLPGIGQYTAAAIAAIAFGKRAVVMDGNIERVTARLFAEPGKKALLPLVERITPDDAGGFAQGMMDLANAICTPRNPRCEICPLEDLCEGRVMPESYPAKATKSAKPHRKGQAWWIERDGEVLLTTRPAKGLLGGMRALPSSDWAPIVAPAQAGAGLATECPTPAAAPACAGATSLGQVTHTFTHFHLTLEVVAISPDKGCNVPLAGEWWPVSRIEEAGLPTLFLKAARLATAREDLLI